MPNRIIKESICSSDSIEGLSWFEEAFFYRLIVNCDDYGRLDARPAILKAKLFPLRERVTHSKISAALRRLVAAGMVRMYASDGRPYMELVSWGRHQRLRNSKEKYPPPPGSAPKKPAADGGEVRRQEESCGLNPNQSETESQAESQAESQTETQTEYVAHVEKNARCARTFTAPTIEQVREYCTERGNSVDAQRFMDHYTANGWRVGKNSMKDWKAAVRTWERNEYSGLGTKKPAALDYAQNTHTEEELRTAGIYIDLDISN